MIRTAYLILGAALWATVSAATPQQALLTDDPPPPKYKIVDCYDGDTCRFVLVPWVEDAPLIKVRLMGFDAPEIRGKCIEEQGLARKARDRLNYLLRNARDLQLEMHGKDRYGRHLAKVFISWVDQRPDGDPLWMHKDVADIMIAEGLARPYKGGKREPWCPE